MALGGASFDEARSELSLWYGHLPLDRRPRLDASSISSTSTSRAAGEDSDWAAFERWAREIYVPYVYSAAIEAAGLPSEASSGERMDVRVRARNESLGPGCSRRTRRAESKLGVKLFDREKATWIDYDRHGHREQVVEPGEVLTLDVAIWAPETPGDYELKLDLVDEHVTWFEDQGSVRSRRSSL